MHMRTWVLRAGDPMHTTEEAGVTRRTPAPIATLWKLGSSAGIEQGPSIVLGQGLTPIGRAVPTDGGIPLTSDHRTSRLHATLELHGLDLRLTDEASKNGTFVNGRRVGQCALGNGDVLRLGDTIFLLRHEKPDAAPDPPIAGLLGSSAGIRALRATIGLVGPTMATVLLLGESGTGKEVAAAALHRQSGRDGPLLAVNCSAIPESLAESQLFGHVAGAFTGASAHPGLFRAAHRGTLFLDEVGDLSRALQPKLLRALEEGAILPVGAVTPVPCDVRLIAATNGDLSQAVRQGTFRRDLYTRLAEIIVLLPPLRDRREDILVLLQTALPSRPRLSPDLIEALLLHPWPGNVRELLKVATELRIKGAAADRLELELVGDRLKSPEAALEAAPGPVKAGRAEASPPPADAPRGAGPVPDRDLLIGLLRQHRGNVADVARAVGRSRKQVYRWLLQHGLDVGEFRDPGKPGSDP